MLRVTHNSRSGAQDRRRRITWWGLMALLLGTLSFPVAGYLYVGLSQAQAASAETTNPRANFWRAVRQGDMGHTTASGEGAGVLIQNGGENWRLLRNGPVANIGPWILATVLGLIALYFIIRGRVRVDQPLSGQRVERWSGGERLMHWYTAILFILLAITGLSLLFGRAVLIPVLGLQGFAAYAEIAKTLHNYLGPLFMVGVVLEVVTWVRYNLFTKADMQWLARAGGMFSKGRHLHAGRANGGEKVWFWIIATVGLVGVCVSGLVLDFPNFGQTRETMQIANIVHASLAIIWIAISFGHIYLGSLGIQGAFEGMVKGDVSKEWMIQHHDLWYAELQRRGATAGAGAKETAVPPPQRPLKEQPSG